MLGSSGVSAFSVSVFGVLASAALMVVRRRAELCEPRAWLEAATSHDALTWVREQNERTFAQADFGSPRESPLHDRLLSILESKDKIPYLTKIGDRYYNFWTDDKHIRGIWRRTTLTAYIAAADPNNNNNNIWETVLDLDALNAEEGGENSWVWKGFRLLHEGPDSVPDLCLLFLSRGGADATVVREFSLLKSAFLPESAQPFEISEAKTRVSYRSRDVLLVGSDFGPGSLTSSGYPRTAMEWKRGTPLSSATQVYEGKITDVAASCSVSHDRGYIYEWRTRSLTFYTSEIQLRVLARDAKAGVVVPNSADVKEEFTVLAVPADADVGVFADRMIVELRSDWIVDGNSFKAGSLLHAPVDDMLKGRVESLSVLFEPNERTSLGYWTGTRNYVILSLLDNVKSRFLFFKYDQSKGFVADQGVGKRLGLDKVSMDKMDCWAEDSEESDRVWMTTTGYITPTTLFVADLGEEAAPQKLRALPSFFNTQGIQVDQHEATSLDGTKIPYFEVYQKSGKGKPQATLLYAYGGFEISMLPGYSATRGALWLERGGVLVVANIRGGGEFGPKWHQAALKEKRPRAFEDLEAVAEHLVSRKVTTAKQLGVMGGSNGGLLVGNMLVRKPELWGAVVCQVPLLDMRRFHKLLAGASWMAEYGNPDLAEEWEFMRGFSPYHMIKRKKNNSNINDDNTAHYPPVLFTTSTRDDRVCPSHARKMVHKLNAMGHGSNVYYYENLEGGHGGAADNKQSAFMWTLSYEFLASKLGLGKPAAL